jgi:L-asparaginase II
MQFDVYEPLVEITRGDIVESVHFGAFCVSDQEGNLLAQAGNPGLWTYPRSALKPFQVLPLIEQGGIDYFGLTGEEIAIMCGSHAGTAFHQAILEGMHRKIGISEADLACGEHWPYDSDARDEMKISGQKPTALHHNCSGKHSGMLALAVLQGINTQDYLDLQHPVQVIIRETLGALFEIPVDEMPVGLDGCSAPVYAVPMETMAHAVARMAEPTGMGTTSAAACRMVTAAMISSPVMVAGPEQFDTDLMIAAGGKVFSKGGAEGYQIIGILPGAIHPSSPGLGIAIKISDGDSRGRARASVALTILNALGVLDEAGKARMGSYGNIPVKNWCNLDVGEVRPVFSLPNSTGLLV